MVSSIYRNIVYIIYKILRAIVRHGENIERYIKFSQGAVIDPSVKLLASAICTNIANQKDLISIHTNSVIRGELLIFAHGGKIDIGKSCYIGEGTRIWSAESIKIGDRCFISHNVNIHDTNSHSLDSDLRFKHIETIILSGHPKDNDFDIQSSPVNIHDDVWIGFNAVILKGVTINQGAIVAAGSVVTKDVPPFSVVAGNPAQVVKTIKSLPLAV
jgi:acetyltransferase-like isoleucine patch superfamily enzyme